MISHPHKNEYNPFYQPYIDRLGDKDILLGLKEQKSEALSLFNTITEEKSDFAYAEGKWSIKEVLQHSNDVERIFTYRALAIARGETQPLPGMDQDSYQKMASRNKRTFSSLVSEFEAIRNSSLQFFEHVSEEESILEGIASTSKVTVRALAAMVYGHLAHHLVIIEQKYL